MNDEPKQSDYLGKIQVYCQKCGNFFATNFYKGGIYNVICQECQPQKEVKKCDCGGIIETHQGNNGFSDSWYCLQCGKDFEKNPFKPQDEAKDLEEFHDFMKDRNLHHKGLDSCFNDAVAVSALERIIKQLLANQRKIDAEIAKAFYSQEWSDYREVCNIIAKNILNRQNND